MDVPFDKHGNQMHFAEPGEVSYYKAHEWKPNCKFPATIRINDYSRGRSAAYFNAVDVNTMNKFTIFLTDMIEIIRTCKLDQGLVSGIWTFRKRGQNYGLQLVSPEPVITPDLVQGFNALADSLT